MLRLITLLKKAAGVELVLPVTPSSYQWLHKAAVETVTVDQLGDLDFFGEERIRSTTLRDCLLPVQTYPFLSPGMSANPRLYLEQLEWWMDRGTVAWWLVSDTPVNTTVLLEGVTYREQDGTNGLYADITPRQYTWPEMLVLLTEPPATSAGTVTSRDSAIGMTTTKACTVVSGDTLWGVCRRYYGDGSLAWRLAAASSVANANLIRPGQVFTTPPLTQLPAAAIRSPSAQIAVATKVREVKEEKSGTTRLALQVPENTVRSLANLELGKIAPGSGL